MLDEESKDKLGGGDRSSGSLLCLDDDLAANSCFLNYQNIMSSL
jgi:hypothetical protein